MTVEAMMAILDKAAKDIRFRERMRTDPQAALAAFDVSPQEAAALQEGTPAALQAVGLDPRLPAWIPWRSGGHRRY